MLKILVRTSLILCAAVLIAGGIYFFVNSRAGQSLILSGRRNGFVRQEPAASQAAVIPLNSLEPRASAQGRNFEGREFRGGVSPQRAVTGIVQNVVVIALITFLVVTVQKVIPRNGRKGPRGAA
jgi:hypothetical protein